MSKSLWKQIWESQGRKCASCGKFVKLQDAAKNSCSFSIVCISCYQKSKIHVILDELASYER